ncbi:MAG: antitoxin [Firmicutes bacterium]|nr:antitoxin [Bacillota bacterium]MBQ7241271.1 antitoxin [Bacillota bacterium]MBR0104217.1 antitoxin [Bacillota bacterium]MBR2593208.1 antitoxin [Bacillota bacterium]
MAFSIRLTDRERKLAESYAKIHGISMGEAFKNALFEKIEDEYDLKVIAAYEKDKENGTLETTTFEELVEELGLTDEIQSNNYEKV